MSFITWNLQWNLPLEKTVASDTWSNQCVRKVDVAVFLVGFSQVKYKTILYHWLKSWPVTFLCWEYPLEILLYRESYVLNPIGAVRHPWQNQQISVNNPLSGGWNLNLMLGFWGNSYLHIQSYTELVFYLLQIVCCVLKRTKWIWTIELTELVTRVEEKVEEASSDSEE